MEIAAFTRLEEKIDGLLELLGKQKEENGRLRSQLEERERQLAELNRVAEENRELQGRLAEKDEELVLLSDELSALEAERVEVKSRIEVLVSKLDNF